VKLSDDLVLEARTVGAVARRSKARNSPPEGGGQPFREQLILCQKTRHQPHQPPTGSEMPMDMVAEVPLTGLSFVLALVVETPRFPVKHCA